MSSDESDLECRASQSKTTFRHQVQQEAEGCCPCNAENVEYQAGEVEEAAEGWIQATEPVESIGADGNQQADMGVYMDL